MASPPEWLARFVNAATTSINSYDVLSPLGCHFQQVQDVWEITVFASRTEIVGGPQDGSLSTSRFNVDVYEVLQQFSKVDAINWQAQSFDSRDDLGAHLSIEGSYENHQIWFRITSTAPEQFEAGRRADVNHRGIEEIW